MRLALRPLHLAIRLGTAAGHLGQRQGWLLLLEDDGLTGRGEASPLPAFGGEAAAACLAALRRCQRLIDDAHVTAAIRALDHTPVARNALTGALLDLEARRRGRPLAKLLQPGCSLRVSCNWLDDGPPAGWQVCKCKAVRDPVASAEALRRLHERRPQLRLRLDANGAWSPADVQRFAEALGDCPLDLLEQPCAPRFDAELPAMQERYGLPMAFDESLRSVADAGRLLALAPAAIVLKPMLLGGADRCLAIAGRARAAGVRTIVTDSCCAATGRRQAAHCAAACDPRGGEHHGLATARLLAEDDGISDGSWQLGGLGIGP